MTEKENKALLELIAAGIKEFPKVLARKERAFKEKQKRMKAFAPLSKALQKQEELAAASAVTPAVHPWRLCPFGQFYRKKHKQKSYVRKNGAQVRGSIHPNECVKSKTGKDQLYAEEIHEIAARNFGALTVLPTSGILTKFPNESKFDPNIAGWTKYWNEVLNPSTPLDSNFVKALIATESGFLPSASNGKRGLKRARGLMQVTDESVRLLSNSKKELADHFVNLNEDDMLDPNLAICAGIRWLFRKKQIAEAGSKVVSWPETVRLYKNYKSMDDGQMQKFLNFYEALKTGSTAKLKYK